MPLARPTFSAYLVELGFQMAHFYTHNMQGSKQHLKNDSPTGLNHMIMGAVLSCLLNLSLPPLALRNLCSLFWHMFDVCELAPPCM